MLHRSEKEAGILKSKDIASIYQEFNNAIRGSNKGKVKVIISFRSRTGSSALLPEVKSFSNESCEDQVKGFCTLGRCLYSDSQQE